MSSALVAPVCPSASPAYSSTSTPHNASWYKSRAENSRGSRCVTNDVSELAKERWSHRASGSLVDSVSDHVSRH